MRRVLVGLTAVAVALGWLQIAPAFGFPVTAPAAMLDRMLGAGREASLFGWLILIAGVLALAAGYFVVVEARTRGSAAPIVYALAAWLLTGAVLMPLIGLIQGAPPKGDAVDDPMRANFFMLNLGAGAAVEAFVAWLLFGVVLAAGRTLGLNRRIFLVAVVGSAAAGVVAYSVPILVAQAESSRVVEGRVSALPPGSVFISVLELPQPPGAVLGPHKHVPGFVLDVWGTATMRVASRGVVDAGPGDALFLESLQSHDHENRAAVPLAIALSIVLIGLTVALLVLRSSRYTIGLTAALLICGTVATVNPLMNHWYFVGIRPAAQRGAVMPVPAGHRTYESQALTGLGTGPMIERLTTRSLGPGQSAHFTGPAAIVVLYGQASVTTGGRTKDVSAQSGITIAGGDDAIVTSRSGSTRVLAVEVLSSG